MNKYLTKKLHEAVGSDTVSVSFRRPKPSKYLLELIDKFLSIKLPR